MAAGREKKVFKTNNRENAVAKPTSKSAITNKVQVSPSEENVQPNHNPQDKEQVNPSIGQTKRNSPQHSVQLEPEPYEVKRKVCNPCGCCCCKCCNLRVNCMCIAVYAVLCALWWTVIGIKSTLLLSHTFAMVLIVAYGIVTFLTAVSITIAVFGHFKEAAFAAFGGWISSGVFFMAFFWTITSFIDDYAQKFDPLNEEIIKEFVGYIRKARKIIIIVVMFMFVPIKIYFAVCCLQHAKQIKLGIDVTQERGYNVIQPDPGELPPPPPYSSSHTPQEE